MCEIGQFRVAIGLLSELLHPPDLALLHDRVQLLHRAGPWHSSSFERGYVRGLHQILVPCDHRIQLLSFSLPIIVGFLPLLDKLNGIIPDKRADLGSGLLDTLLFRYQEIRLDEV